MNMIANNPIDPSGLLIRIILCISNEFQTGHQGKGLYPMDTIDVELFRSSGVGLHYVSSFHAPFSSNIH